MTGPKDVSSPIALFAIPPPRPLASRPAGGSAPEVRDAVADLVGGSEWAAMSWTALASGLAAIGRTDVVLAKLAESHIDALRILDQAGAAPGAGIYGVWASRSQASGVSATPDGDSLHLGGTVRFASGAGLIDRVLVPVWLASGEHLLLDLDPTRWDIDTSQWRTGAMAGSRTHAVTVTGQVPRTRQIGPTSWYLNRPAFEPGGVGVAAVWVGAAARVMDLLARARADAQPSDISHLRRGGMRRHLAAAGAALAVAAAHLDLLLAVERPETARISGIVAEARAVIGASVRAILVLARDLAGPAGLAFNADLGAAIADLDLYVRQQPGDADELRLGST